ncbi:MAG: YggS family pyridoxal phosphate-dependent enzyme [Spirochaetaceae bacterium]|nr:MAG: YggS family pyridoxal phosphate-dependent enzyme [Spirochaetaceae bacterium]
MRLDLQTFTDNLHSVQKRITDTATRAGRDPAEIRLMAVTKTFPPAYIEVARQAGLTLFGENRVQEAQEKYQTLVTAPDLELHLIGHLQRNKAKIAASLFLCVQSIDKLQTAEALNRHCAEIGRTMDILLELNTSGEASKFGFNEAEELWRVCGEIASLDSLRIRGVMTVGPFTADRDRIRRAFADLRDCLDGLRSRFPELPLDTLSMGMSGDFEIAVEEGATCIRLGTILFGSRGEVDE